MPDGSSAPPKLPLSLLAPVPLFVPELVPLPELGVGVSAPAEFPEPEEDEPFV